MDIICLFKVRKKYYFLALCILFFAWIARGINGFGACFLMSLALLGHMGSILNIRLFRLKACILLDEHHLDGIRKRSDIQPTKTPSHGQSHQYFKGIQWGSWIIFSIISGLTFLAFQHKIPGFFNVCVMSNINVSAKSLPFNIWLNWDKSLTALFLLIFCTRWPRCSMELKNTAQRQDATKTVGQVENMLLLDDHCTELNVEKKHAPLSAFFSATEMGMPGSIHNAEIPSQARVHSTGWHSVLYFCLIVFLISAIGLATGYIQWDIKCPAILPLWSLNMLGVCFSEEMFYRAFFQNHLRAILSPFWVNYGAHIGMACLIFAADHAFKGGLLYGFLAGLVGIFYGYIFEKRLNKRCPIIYPMIFHFLFNIFHILMFTYPAAVSMMPPR